MAGYLHRHGHPDAATILDFPLIYPQCQWANRSKNDYDCGVYVIKEMEFFRNGNYSGPSMTKVLISLYHVWDLFIIWVLY